MERESDGGRDRTNIHPKETSIEVVEPRPLLMDCSSKCKSITPRASVRLEMTLTFGQMTVNSSFLLGGDAGEAK
ncbi:hypothetical protein MTR_3g008070 [Medicago truncatula]|uniref:Uncharacterized protein n=1 Tax=Medicago truncatula TaxID=3880 RepID=G7IVK2_MEDTR|nr:hypothetical protein MTR_3g008070 [Medicago truncatula]